MAIMHHRAGMPRVWLHRAWLYRIWSAARRLGGAALFLLVHAPVTPMGITLPDAPGPTSCE